MRKLLERQAWYLRARIAWLVGKATYLDQHVGDLYSRGADAERDLYHIELNEIPRLHAKLLATESVGRKALIAAAKAEL